MLRSNASQRISPARPSRPRGSGAPRQAESWTNYQRHGQRRPDRSEDPADCALTEPELMAEPLDGVREQDRAAEEELSRGRSVTLELEG